MNGLTKHTDYAWTITIQQDIRPLSIRVLANEKTAARVLAAMTACADIGTEQLRSIKVKELLKHLRELLEDIDAGNGETATDSRYPEAHLILAEAEPAKAHDPDCPECARSHGPHSGACEHGGKET